MDKKQGVRAALEQPPAPPLGGGQPPTTQVWASRGPGCEMIPASGQSLPSNLSPSHPAFLVPLPPPVSLSQDVLHSI